LRTSVLVREAGGHQALGAFYAALGERVHERGEALDAVETVAAALEDAGLEPALCEKGWADPSTADQVASEHRALCDRTRSFGVPTIVLDGGQGPAIFGPVVSELPTDEEAVELWRHVSWLVRYENFSELKRDRVNAPDLESNR
jgi:protein-disulfide isomerase-like protein with CxxC motif